MNEMWASVDSILQLIGLGPSLLLISFLILTLKEPDKAVIPLLFMVSLIAAFVSPLMPLLMQDDMVRVSLLLMVVKSILPAAIFLMILQFLNGRLPRFTYWLIILLPLLGGAMLYALEMVGDGEACFSRKALHCMDATLLFSLYSVVSGGLILLLIMPEIARRGTLLIGSDSHRKDKFWLVVALVIFTLLLLILDLLKIGGVLEGEKVQLIHTVIRLLFVFLMFTSLFRVFNQQFALEMQRIPIAQRLLTSEDEALAMELKRLCAEEHIYREMGLCRAFLAKRLGVSEAHLSRIVNRYYKCNLNSFLNQYRVEEAKVRLAEGEAAITTIAFEVGFNSIASFNRVFKESTDHSPREYRNNNS